KKVGRVLKRRYFKGKGYSNPKLGQMVKDVRFFKSIVNAEKKRVSYNTLGSPLQVAQVTGNSSGHQLWDGTPLPAQGSGYNQRTGNSIKWHSVHFTFQFTHQSAADQSNKVMIYLVKTVGRIYTTGSNFITDFLQTNPFVNGTVYDTNSPRVQETYKNFIVLKKKAVYMPADQISSVPYIKTVDFGHKFKSHHVRWATDNTAITDGQVWVLLVAMNGNHSATTPSTLNSGVPLKTISTGIQFNYVQTNYYYDN
ncbi:MAG: hypothetical protein H7836_17140, partial [Magnetococcus sp. YQC-3]